MRQPKPPSVLLEIGYHDNTADAVWIQDNVQNIAENLSRSLAEYFALPFIYPMPPRTGTVVTERDALNVRAYPAMSGQVVGSVPHEAQLMVYGQTESGGVRPVGIRKAIGTFDKMFFPCGQIFHNSMFFFLTVYRNEGRIMKDYYRAI